MQLVPEAKHALNNEAGRGPSPTSLTVFVFQPHFGLSEHSVNMWQIVVLAAQPPRFLMASDAKTTCSKLSSP